MDKDEDLTQDKNILLGKKKYNQLYLHKIKNLIHDKKMIYTYLLENSCHYLTSAEFNLPVMS